MSLSIEKALERQIERADRYPCVQPRGVLIPIHPTFRHIQEDVTLQPDGLSGKIILATIHLLRYPSQLFGRRDQVRAIPIFARFAGGAIPYRLPPRLSCEKEQQRYTPKQAEHPDDALP